MHPGLGIIRIRFNGYNLSPNSPLDLLRTKSLAMIRLGCVTKNLLY